MCAVIDVREVRDRSEGPLRARFGNGAQARHREPRLTCIGSGQPGYSIARVSVYPTPATSRHSSRCRSGSIAVAAASARVACAWAWIARAVSAWLVLLPRKVAASQLVVLRSRYCGVAFSCSHCRSVRIAVTSGPAWRFGPGLSRSSFGVKACSLAVPASRVLPTRQGLEDGPVHRPGSQWRRSAGSGRRAGVRDGWLAR